MAVEKVKYRKKNCINQVTILVHLFVPPVANCHLRLGLKDRHAKSDLHMVNK